MSTRIIPKTDWGSSDGVGEGDLNRIEGNIEVLFQGNGQDSLETVSVDSGSADIGTNNAAFNFSASAYETRFLSYISTTGRKVGNIITVKISSSESVALQHDAGSVPAGYASIHLKTGAAETLNTNDVAQFMFGGTYWHCINIT